MFYLDSTDEERNNPVWSLTVYEYEGRFDAKANVWRRGKWQKVETIDISFREPFRILSRGDDYYFLTTSGNLFRAAKPEKGKHRKMEAIWKKPDNPVTAFITDADEDRTFLFCDSGSKPAVFEMASGVRLRRYDPKLFRPGDQGPDELRRVVGYARILQSLGYVKVPFAGPEPKPR